jgi:hypothetical protein
MEHYQLGLNLSLRVRNLAFVKPRETVGALSYLRRAVGHLRESEGRFCARTS